MNHVWTDDEIYITYGMSFSHKCHLRFDFAEKRVLCFHSLQTYLFIYLIAHCISASNKLVDKDPEVVAYFTFTQ